MPSYFSPKDPNEYLDSYFENAGKQYLTMNPYSSKVPVVDLKKAIGSEKVREIYGDEDAIMSKLRPDSKTGEFMIDLVPEAAFQLDAKQQKLVKTVNAESEALKVQEQMSVIQPTADEFAGYLAASELPKLKRGPLDKFAEEIGFIDDLKAQGIPIQETRDGYKISRPDGSAIPLREFKSFLGEANLAARLDIDEDVAPSIFAKLKKFNPDELARKIQGGYSPTEEEEMLFNLAARIVGEPAGPQVILSETGLSPIRGAPISVAPKNEQELDYFAERDKRARLQNQLAAAQRGTRTFEAPAPKSIDIDEAFAPSALKGI